MKMKLISIIMALVLGTVAVVSSLSAYMERESSYNNYLEKARYNAQREIPYNAYQNYQKAFAIRCESESVYQEYIEQCRLLGADYYAKAVEEYVERFPNSSTAYEMLCRRHYENGSYKSVVKLALEARQQGAATEQVRLWYMECAYMLKNVSSGYEEVQSMLGGYARVKVGGKYGFIKQSGKYVIAPRYEQASTYMNECASVLEDGVWQVVNSLGYRVALPDRPVDSLGMIVGGIMSVSVDGKYGYTDASLQIPTELPYAYASTFKNGVAAVEKDGKWALINTSRELVTDFIFDDIVLDEYDVCINSGVIFVCKDGKYYMMNAEGTKISDQAFDAVQPFADGGLAAVAIGGKWGFVDPTGSVVIEPQYEGARSFGAGLGGVCIDGLWGYVSKSGELLVECQFEDCMPFNASGIAAVKENGLWKFVQLLGYQVSGG